jgi:hypothetical protein
MCSLVWEEWDVVDARYLQNSLTVVQQAFEEEAAASPHYGLCDVLCWMALWQAVRQIRLFVAGLLDWATLVESVV